jgi:hypothetical protein
MGFTANNWVGSSGGGSFFNSGSSSGGGGLGLNGTEFMPKHWDSSSDPTPGKDSTSFDWARSLPAGSDPFGFNKTLNQDKKQTPWENTFRAAGESMAKYGQDNIAQGKKPDGLTPAGGLVAQGENFMVIQPPSPTFLPPEQSTLSKVASFVAPFASLIPGVGPYVSAGLGAASKFV